jgi:hypothetical protein
MLTPKEILARLESTDANSYDAVANNIKEVRAKQKELQPTVTRLKNELARRGIY